MSTHLTREQRRQAWAAMSAGRDDLYGLDLGRSSGRDAEPRRRLLARMAEGAAVLALAFSVGAVTVLTGREQNWTDE